MVPQRITTEISKIIDNNKVIARGRLTEDCIHDLDVDQDYRRQGLATEIISELMHLGGKRLWVKSGNDAAISLYQKLGFAITREDSSYYEMEFLS